MSHVQQSLVFHFNVSLLIFYPDVPGPFSGSNSYQKMLTCRPCRFLSVIDPKGDIRLWLGTHANLVQILISQVLQAMSKP